MGLACNFQWCFQMTQDWWLVLLALDVLIAWLCWRRPLNNNRSAAAWGLFGGLSALVSPVVGWVWGLLTVMAAYRERAWSRLAMAGLLAGLTLAPWTLRNYLVFGRFIPVKSNLAYELYQSQCLQPDGLVQKRTLQQHPYTAARQQGRDYNALGEIAFMDRKKQQFQEAIVSHPAEFLKRLAHRFLGATLWYEPFDRAAEARRPVALWSCRLLHPLPLLAGLVLAGTSTRRRLLWVQWVVICVYISYLLPYIGASYYERYAVPLLGTKVLLVSWAVERLTSELRNRRYRNARLSISALVL
jgi:hypothetical protein